MNAHVAGTYFVPVSLGGAPVDPDSDLLPLLAEEDLP